jgi:hypothetical protein
MFFNNKDRSKLKKLDKLVKFPIIPPNGISLEIGSNKYLIKRGKRYKFYSERVFDSWGLYAIPVTESNLPLAGTLGFRDGTLIQNMKDGKIYLISDAQKRQVTRPPEDYGFDWGQVILASNDEIELHLDGEDI